MPACFAGWPSHVWLFLSKPGFLWLSLGHVGLSQLRSVLIDQTVLPRDNRPHPFGVEAAPPVWSKLMALKSRCDLNLNHLSMPNPSR